MQLYAVHWSLVAQHVSLCPWLSGFAEEYNNAKDMLAQARSKHEITDGFMAARSELVRLCEAGALPLKVRAGKADDLQNKLKDARKRALVVLEGREAASLVNYQAMTIDRYRAQ